MKDSELIAAVLELPNLTEAQEEAFRGMAEWLDQGDGRGLSAKQREWCLAVATANNLVVEEPKNLYSAGLVPDGIKLPKTDGEKKAAEVLAQRPLAPPGRRSA